MECLQKYLEKDRRVYGVLEYLRKAINLLIPVILGIFFFLLKSLIPMLLQVQVSCRYAKKKGVPPQC